MPMLVVEIDSLPIGEAFSGPSAGDPHSVVFECQPGMPFGDASLTGIEPEGDSFVGEIRIGCDVATSVLSFRPTIVFGLFRHDFESACQKGAIIHFLPRFAFAGFRAQLVSLGKTGQVFVGNVEVLIRISLLDKMSTNVTDD